MNAEKTTKRITMSYDEYQEELRTAKNECENRRYTESNLCIEHIRKISNLEKRTQSSRNQKFSRGNTLSKIS